MPTKAWKTTSYSGWYKVERVGATGRAELKMVMADSGVNVGTNTGRVNKPEATEETPSLVLALKADAEEIKGCGALLAEMPRTEEEACEDALPWIDEIMAGMEFPIVQTTASVRESAKWGDQELEAVLDTGLSDVAVDGRKAVVGRARWTRHYKGQPETLQQKTNHNRNYQEQWYWKPLRPEKTLTEPRENATLLKLKTKPTKIRAEPRETLCY